MSVSLNLLRSKNWLFSTSVTSCAIYVIKKEHKPLPYVLVVVNQFTIPFGINEMVQYRKWMTLLLLTIPCFQTATAITFLAVYPFEHICLHIERILWKDRIISWITTVDYYVGTTAIIRGCSWLGHLKLIFNKILLRNNSVYILTLCLFFVPSIGNINIWIIISIWMKINLEILKNSQIIPVTQDKSKPVSIKAKSTNMF